MSFLVFPSWSAGCGEGRISITIEPPKAVWPKIMAQWALPYNLQLMKEVSSNLDEKVLEMEGLGRVDPLCHNWVF